jgi:hypothetical protein
LVGAISSDKQSSFRRHGPGLKLERLLISRVRGAQRVLRCQAGRTIDEVVPPFALVLALHSADACAASSGRVIYTVFRTRDMPDRVIGCERLLPPLGADKERSWPRCS